MAFLIRGGRVVDPSQGIDALSDVLIDNDHIAGVGANLPVPDGAEIVDATGMIVAPALIDIHVHFRDPGFLAKESLETGAASAVRAGFASVCCMPNTNPPLDTAERIADIVERSRALPVRVYPIGTITVGRRGEELADLEGMAAAGAFGFSDDGDSTRSSQVMREALEWSVGSGKPIMVHSEDWTLINGGVMNEGAVSRELGLPGVPATAEEITTSRDIELARLTGGWLHVLHVSTARGRALVQAAKREGVNVTAEVMPHHLLMTDEWVAGRRRFVGETTMIQGPSPDPNAKVNPALRTETDARALLAGLHDGTFDVLATDHAPHAREDKPDDLTRAASGMIGLEVAVPLLLKLVQRGDLSVSALIDLFSTRPARIFSLPGGTLRVGSIADVVVIDPTAEWVVSEETIASRSKNTPLLGMTLTGQAKMTVVGGEIRYRA